MSVQDTTPSMGVMTPATMPSHLFRTPRLAEESKPYYQPLYPQGVAASMSANAGLSGLGAITPIQTGVQPVDVVQDFLAQGHNAFMDFLGGLTGQNAQAQAQENAIALAQVQAQAAAYQAQASAAFWDHAIPWLAVAGLGAAVVVVYAVVK